MNTVLKVDGKVADKVKDDFFKRVEIERKSEKDFFVEDSVKKVELLKKKAQNDVDTKVKKAVDEGYL